MTEPVRIFPLDAMVDALMPDGNHRYWSTHCRHGHHGACSATTLGDSAGNVINRNPSACRTCGAPCVCGCHEGGTEWAPGAGWVRLKRERPDLAPDLTEEDLRRADEIIEMATRTQPGDTG